MTSWSRVRDLSRDPLLLKLTLPNDWRDRKLYDLLAPALRYSAGLFPRGSGKPGHRQIKIGLLDYSDIGYGS